MEALEYEVEDAMVAEPDDLDIRFLGPVSVRHNGVELAVGSARRGAVFSVLALQANHAVSRERLIAAVWGEKPPHSARGNVYTYVSELRQMLEPARGRWAAGQRLTSHSGNYGLYLPECTVDVYRFDALRDKSRRHRADGDRQAELFVLTQALGMWRGEALQGVPGPYAEAQRLRLTELRIATEERRAGTLIELSRHDEAIAELRTLVETYPARENSHALLMTALQAAGRRSEALTVYERISTLLRERTGTEPGAALRALHSRIVSTGRQVSPPPSPRRISPAFVGRDAELRLLRKAVADVRAGRGEGIWLKGTPGMGKSTLLTTALRNAAPTGYRLGWGVGDELARHISLGVLLECLESAFADQDQDLVEQLLAVVGAARAGANSDTEHRVVSIVRRAAADGPLILVLDDLESADDDTLRIWAALHRLTGDLPLLLIGASRPAAGDHRLDALRGMHPHEVQLYGLSPAEAATLVRMVAPEPPDPRTLHRLITAAGGSPYYLRRLAATPWPGPEATGGPPAEIVAAVGERLDPFAEETRQVLRAVAFLDAGPTTGDGRAGCTIHEVAAVTGRPVEDLLHTLASARDAGLLADTGQRLTLRHPIVGRVLREGTPATLRVMLHRSFAEKIATAGSAPERVVAQLLAGPAPLDGWPGHWLDQHVEELGVRAPGLAVAVLQRARAEYNLDHGRRITLTAWLARLLFRSNRNAIAEAGWVANRTDDVVLAAEMGWIVAVTRVRLEQSAAAAEVVRTVLSGHRAPDRWLTRFRGLLDEIRPKLPDGRGDSTAGIA
ncbi:BTAD domain-containing putative transcriptional regulator [Micromonospora sp. NBC_00858]|uniref:BTAD domain-containing putative transcriptional regulator n=1 Tax=Micromonospora sp. NBC_00858 TaxID=2975979 RepID=UPI00386E0EDF|nr:AAA family ATPase [Micromonospora sp. NBC_00858]